MSHQQSFFCTLRLLPTCHLLRGCGRRRATRDGHNCLAMCRKRPEAEAEGEGRRVRRAVRSATIEGKRWKKKSKRQKNKGYELRHESAQTDGYTADARGRRGDESRTRPAELITADGPVLSSTPRDRRGIRYQKTGPRMRRVYRHALRRLVPLRR